MIEPVNTSNQEPVETAPEHPIADDQLEDIAGGGYGLGGIVEDEPGKARH